MKPKPNRRRAVGERGRGERARLANASRWCPSGMSFVHVVTDVVEGAGSARCGQGSERRRVRSGETRTYSGLRKARGGAAQRSVTKQKEVLLIVVD